jgi:tRNA uridine 5-carboxymethylaminomethyl modification enzyme
MRYFIIFAAADVLLCLQGPRAQVSRTLYRKAMQETLNKYENLSIKAGSVLDMVLGPRGARSGNSNAEDVYGEMQGIRTGGLPP